VITGPLFGGLVLPSVGFAKPKLELVVETRDVREVADVVVCLFCMHRVLDFWMEVRSPVHRLIV
jgi:hypothetical protein